MRLMSVVEPIPSLSFQKGVEELLQLVACLPIENSAEKEEVYRLRYEAYRRERALPAQAPVRFCDRFDEEANAKTFGVYVDGRLCSALRIHVVDRHTPEHPGLAVYPDHVLPRIAEGETLIDPTRFVADLEASRLHPKLPYATVRIAWMACEWFGADTLLATVRAEHQAFYRRLFGHEVLCAPRAYPTLTKPLSLMALAFPRHRDRVTSRYRFFESTPAERRSLFGSWVKQPRSDAGLADRIVA